MKILVIFTGGTIGSVVSENCISPDFGQPYKLIEEYYKQKISEKYRDIFDTCVPYTLLSEDLTGEYLAKLGACIKENLNKDYDGIIVAHGTDTLQYSAVMTGYLTGGASIPVVFVSSNYVLEDKRANGLDNFSCAVDFIAGRNGKGTFVAYRNMDGVVYIHRATRVLPHLPYSDEVYSIANQYYGKFTKHVHGEGVQEEILEEADEWRYEANAEYCVKEEDCGVFEQLPQAWNSGILRIYPYPGMEYPDFSENVRAVLLDTYHSGTLCSVTPHMSVFFEEAKKRNIPVFIAGANTETDYASFQIFEQKNVQVLRNLSPIAAYMKLWLVLESGEEVSAVMKKSLAEDCV